MPPFAPVPITFEPRRIEITHGADRPSVADLPATVAGDVVRDPRGRMRPIGGRLETVVSARAGGSVGSSRADRGP